MGSSGALSGASAAVVPLAQTVVTSAVSNVDLTGISQLYEDLLLRIVARGTQTAVASTVQLQFNGDTTAIYDRQLLQGTAAAASASESLGQTSIGIGGIPAASADAGYAGLLEVLIPNYARTTFNKVLRSNTGRVTSTTTGTLFLQDVLGVWRSTAAINRVKLTLSSGNFDVGSVVTLYGRRGPLA